MISLSLVSFKWDMGYQKKRWHAQEAWPKKNGHISVHEKKEKEEKDIYVAMSSWYPNKGERDS